MRRGALLLFCAFASASGSDLFRLAPPDTAVLIGINFEQLRSSKLGQSVLDRLRAQSPGLKKWSEKGLDPFDNFQEFLVALPAKDQSGRGLVLMRGRCDPATTAQWAQAARASTPSGAPVQMQCLDGSVLVAGDPQSVRAVMANRGGGRGADPALVAQATEMAAGHDFWLVSRASPAELALEIPGGPQAEILKSIRQASFGLKLGPTLLLAADLGTRSDGDAASLATTLKLLSGVAASQQQQTAPALAKLLGKLDLRPAGSSVKISLAIAQDDLEQAFRDGIQGLFRRPPPQDTSVTIYSSPSDMGVVTLPPPKKNR